jgi:hypothetical protein
VNPNIELAGGELPIDLEAAIGFSLSGAFRVSWQSTGIYVWLAFEGPDGARSEAQIGPIPVANIAILSAYASLEAYLRAAGYGQVPYAVDILYAANIAGVLPAGMAEDTI